MKTIFKLAVLLLLFSCKAVQKSAEEQYRISENSHTASANSTREQNLDHTEVKRSQLVSLTTADNGFERVIEENVLEYDASGKSGLVLPALSNSRVVQTKRVIKERGKSNTMNVQQSGKQDSLQQRNQVQSVVSTQSRSDSTTLMHQNIRRMQRKGVPWYVWGGGAVAVSAALWFKMNRVKIGVGVSNR